MPSLARHEWAKRISEFVLGHGLKPITKFQHIVPIVRNQPENQFRSWAPWSLVLNFVGIDILKFQKNLKKIPDVDNNVLYGLAKS
jgi:hypothetical protein